MGKNKISPPKKREISVWLFIFSLLFSAFTFYLLLAHSYEFLVLDDFNHLARARWSIFGERKITVLQRENPVNYSWLFQFSLKPFCYSEDIPRGG